MKKVMTIILVEDEPAILRGLSAAIDMFCEGCEVIGAVSSGEAALDLIQAYQPDVVFTDIQMPCMNGLELIAKARSISPHTSFVILTGYADFSYAQKAIQLQVQEYLLKPVDPEKLQKIMLKLKQKRSLSSTSSHLQALLFTSYGALTSHLTNELTTASCLAGSIDVHQLESIAFEHHVQLSLYPSNYYNERIFSLVSTNDRVSDIQKCAKSIYKNLQSEKVFSNAVLSPVFYFKTQKQVADIIRNCYLFAMLHIEFSKSNYFEYDESLSSSNQLNVSENARRLIKPLSEKSELADYFAICDSLISYWESANIKQLQLQTDLRYLLNKLLSNISRIPENSPDPCELISQSDNYDNLKENIIDEIKRLILPVSGICNSVSSAEALAYEVKAYLDQNYSSPLTGKDFFDLFSYNEKYICRVFKEHFHITPSKYISQLRLQASRTLMKNNPSMLLKDIATSVGYEDPLYFSRVFKNTFGVSPKVYQKKLHTPHMGQSKE